MEIHKLVLIILDGWGVASKPIFSAIAHANTPFISQLYLNSRVAKTKLEASGPAVGLPVGQMGNSEVGHITIGAGRIVPQPLVRINHAIKDGSFFNNSALLKALTYASQSKKNIHFIGLVSDGGIHSHINHLKALCTAASQYHVPFFVHAITDGRDTSPHSAAAYLKSLSKHLIITGGKLASIIGRYYAMDRDNRWERIQKAYNLLVKGEGTPFATWEQALDHYNKQQITDEFLPPIALNQINDMPTARVNQGDVVVFFNFRTDRGRQLTEVLTQKSFPQHQMKPLPLHYYTMTPYDETFANIEALYNKPILQDTLGEILSQHKKTQIRIAETEKYPHVTYFFSGGHEEPFSGESRILCPSPKVATYDLEPKMSAHLVTKEACFNLLQKQPDFMCVNFANADMVGHTGNWNATILACETIDSCLQQIVEVAQKTDYAVMITSDHGNADHMLTPKGLPYTAHTNNPVPCFFIPAKKHNCPALQEGQLEDIAPTILKYLKIPQPLLMTGQSLF